VKLLRRGSRGGRPIAFDAEAYKGGNVVERCVNRLEDFRARATKAPVESLSRVSSRAHTRIDSCP